MLKSINDRLIRVVSNRYFDPIAAALIGMVIFVFIYGFTVLDPTNANWLLSGEDISQHYVGWQFYRASEWTFPLGVASNLAYPHGLAVTFMDSIPLLAIPFKVIAPILPESFQYFGLWGLFCFMLQGALAALIVRHWTNNKLIIIFASIIFVISPVLPARMFVHTALGGQWLILLGILMLVKTSRIKSARTFVVLWSVALGLSVAVHPYLLGMNMALLLVAAAIRYDTIKNLIMNTMVPLVVAVMIFWIIGGFTVGSGASSGLGDYGFDLMSLICPQGWSYVLGSSHKDLVNVGESLTYLGFGILLAGAVVSVYYILRLKDKAFRRKISKQYKPRYAVAALILIVLFILSVSPEVKFGTHLLFEYNIPHAIEKVWSIFRASARLFWPIYYLVIVGVIVGCIRMLGRRNEILTLSFFAVILMIQSVDILQSGNVAQIRDQYHNKVIDARYDNGLDDEYWSSVAKDKKHVVFMGALEGSTFYRLSEFALTHGMTMNTGYFARTPAESIDENIRLAKNELVEGRPRADTLYITHDLKLIGDGFVGGDKLDVSKREYNLYVISARR